MRRLLVLAVLVAAVLLTVYRQRVFLRDPLGKVERNGIVQEGARVFINYSNDVLLQEPGDGHLYLLVQGWNGGVPGVPARLQCVTGMMCWTDANQAGMAVLGGRARSGAMSSREVSFTDEGGVGVRVELR